MKQKVTIIGTGSFGTALASILADNKIEVLMFGVVAKEVNDINNFNRNLNYFNDIKLNKLIKATLSFQEAINFSDYVFICVPSFAIKSIVYQINNFGTKKYNFIHTSKGMVLNYNLSASEMFSKFINSNFLNSNSGIYGPSFANEIILKKPVFFSICSKHNFVLNQLKKMFENNYVKIKKEKNILVHEYFAILKNPLAILSGFILNQTNSKNFESIIISKGINEIKLIIKYLLNQNKINISSILIADAILTTTSLKSRNFNFGYNLKLDKNILNLNPKVTVEGINTLNSIQKRIGLDFKKFKLFYFLYQLFFLKKEINQEYINLLS